VNQTRLPACLPAFLPACLPACLPALSGSKWNYLLMKASCKKKSQVPKIMNARQPGQFRNGITLSKPKGGLRIAASTSEH